MANKRILCISDQHAPYQHPDTIRFLAAIKEKYDPDTIINVGDEADKHALSFHDSDPDLPSAGDEFDQACEFIWQLEEMFPKMTVLESNHGSLAYRKARSTGISKKYLKTYKELYDTPGWNWVPYLELTLPNKQPCFMAHQINANARTAMMNKMMSIVQGHFHEKFEICYWGNGERLNFAMSIACLIDDHSMAFAYNKVFPKRPIVGTGMIIDSQPRLIPMVLNKKGRWNGRIN